MGFPPNEPQPTPAAQEQAEPAQADEPKTKPTLAELQGQTCPNCHVGVLQVVVYDPEAQHEQGDNRALVREGESSGGSYQVQCPHCTFSESRPLDPGPNWGGGV